VTARAERLFLVSLGQRLRFLRRVRRLTTRELAARSGLAPATVNAVELGVRVPSAIVLLRLAAGLQVPWVALVEPAHEEAERMVREAWVPPVPELSPASPVRVTAESEEEVGPK
jgi:XRE family transcriptional regulator, regulator of sulfur utilization